MGVAKTAVSHGDVAGGQESVAAAVGASAVPERARGQPGTLSSSGNSGSAGLRKFGHVSPKEIIAQIAADDPSLTKVDFSGNASFQVRASARAFREGPDVSGSPTAVLVQSSAHGLHQQDFLLVFHMQ